MNSVATFLCSWFFLMAISVIGAEAQPSAKNSRPPGTQPQNIRVSEVPMISSGGLAGGMMSPTAPVVPFPRYQVPLVTPPEPGGDGPVLGIGFEGLEFDDNAVENGTYFIPPDPNGAAGPDRVISVVNCIIEARTKAGVLLYKDGLSGFFSPLLPATFTFDPKVIYDQYADRFVVVTLEQVTGAGNPDPANKSKIFLAVSKTSSPATATSADWYYAAIDAKTVISGSEYWADYPGFAVDEEAVYITNNMFRFITNASGGVRLWIVAKGIVGGFYGGGAASVAIYNPYATAGIATTTQPAHVFGAGGVPGGLIGTFLVSYSGLTSGGLELVQVVRVDDPLGAPAFIQEYVAMGDIDATATLTLPDAPQLGTATPVEVNDRRALNAVWRSGFIWLSATLIPPSGADVGQTTAHWFKLGTALVPGGAITLSDQGNIGGEDIAATTYTFFPSIAVNTAGDAAIGFSASASTIYPGAYFTGRFAADPAGTNRGSGVVHVGEDFYIRTFGGPRNRWGDYSGASIDPSDDGFWIFNEYAKARGTIFGGEDGRWRTAWGKFQAAALPIQLASFTGAVINGNSVRLDWRTISEINNYGFEIEKSLGNSNNYEPVPNSFVPGHGTTNEPQVYSFTEVNVPQGAWYYRLKQIDLDGTTHYYEGVRVDVLLTSVSDDRVPTVAALRQNYPNPFNPSTTISFDLPASSNVNIEVFDMLGRKVGDVLNETKKAGTHQIKFDASGLTSGVYFYKLTTKDFSSINKMMLLR